MDYLSFTSFKKDSEDGVDVDSCLRTSSYVKSLCPRIGRSIENKQPDSKVSSNTFYDLSRIVTHCPSDTDSCLRAPDRFKRFACDLFYATVQHFMRLRLHEASICTSDFRWWK